MPCLGLYNLGVSFPAVWLGFLFGMSPIAVYRDGGINITISCVTTDSHELLTRTAVCEGVHRSVIY